MSLLNPHEEKIKKSVERNENEWGYCDNIIYSRCIEDVKNVKISEIEIRHVKGPIRTFLVNWGRMGRVLENPKRKYIWQEGLITAIHACQLFLEGVREMDIEKIDLTRLENNIKNCYSKIRDFVGPTSASKILHVLSPDLFPMWDMNIRKKISDEKRKEGERSIEETAEGYYRFMFIIKEFIHDNKNVILELNKKYRKSKLRIVDEYMWIVCNP